MSARVAKAFPTNRPHRYGLKSITATSSAAKVSVAAPPVQVTGVSVTSSRLADGTGVSK